MPKRKPHGTVESRRAYMRDWLVKNRDKHRASGQRYRDLHKEEKKLAQRIYRAANIDKINDKRLRKDYGISLAERNARFEQQGRVCAICKADNPGRKQDWSADHCHLTKKFRGVLCHHCNVGLGHFRDNPELLKQALVYLGVSL